MIISLKSEGFIRAGDCVKANPDGRVKRMKVNRLRRYRRKIKGLVFGLAVSSSRGREVMVEIPDPIHYNVTLKPRSDLRLMSGELGSFKTLRLLKFAWSKTDKVV